MGTPLRVLMVEDNPNDAILLIRELSRGDFDPTYTQVENAAAMVQELSKSEWDIVIADYSLPNFSGIDALRILKDSKLDLPFIIVSGAIGEDIAVAAMKAGVHDFIRKGRLYRLVPAIQRELQEAARRAAHRKAERKLHVTLEKLVQSNGQLDEFAYIVSHDLKEPLRGIHNYSAFLIEDYQDKLDDAGRDKLQTLIKLTQRMEGLIDSLLHFSRIGQTELALSPTDLNVAVQEILESLHVSLVERNVTVTIQNPLPSLVCDGPRVTEVFRNLITNAIKYNDKESVSIEIGHTSREMNSPNGSSPALTESYDDEVFFYIKDNGIGIREKQFDIVFRMFRRLHAQEKFGGGTGIGLAIVKKIVEQHGGRVWIESKVGEGTVFFFTLKGALNAELATDCPVTADLVSR